MFSRLGEVNEAQSSVPSRMKRITALDIKTYGSLKVKRHTLVITNCDGSSNSKGKIKGMGKLLLTLLQFGRLTSWRIKLDWLKRQKSQKMQKTSNIV